MTAGGGGSRRAKSQLAAIAVECHQPTPLADRPGEHVQVCAATGHFGNRNDIVSELTQLEDRGRGEILVDQQLRRHTWALSIATNVSSLNNSAANASAA